MAAGVQHLLPVACLSGCLAGVSLLRRRLRSNLARWLNESNEGTWQWMAAPVRPLAVQIHEIQEVSFVDGRQSRPLRFLAEHQGNLREKSQIKPSQSGRLPSLWLGQRRCRNFLRQMGSDSETQGHPHFGV